MNRHLLLVFLILLLAAFTTGVFAQPALDDYGDPRDPAVLAEMIENARDEFYLIDVRTPSEFADGHIPTAINIDHRQIAAQLQNGDRTQTIVLYCRTGVRSSRAEASLRAIGYTEIVNFGGVVDWPGSLERGE